MYMNNKNNYNNMNNNNNNLETESALIDKGSLNFKIINQ